MSIDPSRNTLFRHCLVLSALMDSNILHAEMDSIIWRHASQWIPQFSPILVSPKIYRELSQSNPCLFGIGPKVYMALASKQVDGYSGSTRLHCDLCDAINSLVHCAPPTGTALWHIFKVTDVEKIRAYIRGTPKFRHPHDNDPIHSQLSYLGPRNLAELKAVHGVIPFTIHQAVGEAVFIPAGCPHQVCFVKRIWIKSSFIIIALTCQQWSELHQSRYRLPVSWSTHRMHKKPLPESFASQTCRMFGRMMYYSSMRSCTTPACHYGVLLKKPALNSNQ